MSTPEKKVKLRVAALLDSYEAYRHSPVQNGMGSPTLDFVGCYKGFYYSVETKAANKKPTARQELTIQAIRKAGGRAFVVNEVSGMDELEMWLKEV